MLVDNAKWMTVAIDISAQDNNWSRSRVGRGEIFRGHTNTRSTQYYQASQDFSLVHVEADCTARITRDRDSQKRIHSLSTEGLIGDLSGNVHEWTSDFNMNDKPAVGTSFIAFSNILGSATMAVESIIPQKTLSPFWDKGWDKGEGLGLFYPGLNGQGGALARGGYAFHVLNFAGIFAALLNDTSTEPYPSIGFRCVFQL